MLIINLKVIVAHFYRNITDPSAHHEMSSPWAKIGPKQATVIPWQTTSSCASWAWGTFPSCHTWSVTHCMKPVTALKAKGAEDFLTNEEKRSRYAAYTFAMNRPPVKAWAWSFTWTFYLHSSGIWGRHETCNNVHETVFGFLLRSWCNFITQKNAFIILCLLQSLITVSYFTLV